MPLPSAGVAGDRVATARGLSRCLRLNEGEEPAHIHIKAGSDEAKFWLTPIHLAANYGFNGRELTQIQRLVEEHRTEFLETWNEYFSA